MNLDELVQQISATSEDRVARGLAKLVREWKSDDTTVLKLRESVERYLGNRGVESTSEHEQVYGLWSRFRDEAIDAIGGMTMNERLACFGLFPLFDACQTEEDRARFRSKLLASP